MFVRDVGAGGSEYMVSKWLFAPCLLQCSSPAVHLELDIMSSAIAKTESQAVASLDQLTLG